MDLATYTTHTRAHKRRESLQLLCRLGLHLLLRLLRPYLCVCVAPWVMSVGGRWK